MKIKILFPTVCLLCALTLLAASAPRGDSHWLIKLRNRQFIPPQGIDPALQKTLQDADAFPVHGIVQLYKLAPKAERDALQQYGVYLRQFLGGTAFLSEFSNKVSFATVTNKLVRWAGLLLPQDKTQKSLWEGKIEPWARTRSGEIRVLAEFHRYMSDEEIRTILKGYTPTFDRFNYDFEWAIEISHADLKRLAAEQSVAWLRQGPYGFNPPRL